MTGEEVVERRPPTATAVVRSAGVAQPVWYFGISPAALPLTAVTALATLASSIPRAATIVAVVTVSTAAAAAAAVSTCRERIIVGDSRAIKQAKCTAYVHASAQRGRCFRMRTVAALATSVRVATTATSPVRCGVRAERRQDSYNRPACARRAPVAALGDKPGGRTWCGEGSHAHRRAGAFPLSRSHSHPGVSGIVPSWRSARLGLPPPKPLMPESSDKRSANVTDADGRPTPAGRLFGEWAMPRGLFVAS